MTISPIQQHSSFRAVFESEDSRKEFSKFLNTILYQLDDRKVFEKMDQILADPNRTDEQIYQELVAQVDGMKKPFSIWHQLKALSVLLKGMGRQAAQLLRELRPEEFHNYAEIYFKRYLKTIQKTAKLSLDGNRFAVSDRPFEGGIKERIEAASLFTSYPYQTHVPLNEASCVDPEMEVEKTYQPLGDAIPDASLDLVSALGGFHHIPEDRLGPFVNSLRAKLRPGGVVLLREHNVENESLRDMVNTVHAFANAGNHIRWEAERNEVRAFRSVGDWTEYMQQHGFVPISNEASFLPDDPTQNAMMAFARSPDNLQELQMAAKFRKDSVRTSDSTRATWIEWGNVRYSKQFAQFIQSKHAYAFDSLGHLAQHWKYFTTYIKESRKELPLKKIILSENFSMNLFILLSTTFECTATYLSHLPKALIGRLVNGTNWRNDTNLSALEKEQAKIEQEYATFVDHTPFYLFPYVSKISSLWSAVWSSNEKIGIKCLSYSEALLSTIGLLFKGAVCMPIRMLYTKQGQCIEPDQIGILIHDPKNEFVTGDRRIGGEEFPIRVAYETPDRYKLVLVPRYRIFTELCQELARNNGQETLMEIGSQTKITLDVMYDKDEETIAPHNLKSVKLLYEMDQLQDDAQRRYATYQVDVNELKDFIRVVGADKIEYVHE